MARALMWLVPMWTLAVALLIAFLSTGQLRKAGRWLAVAVALVAVIPWLPSSHAEPRRKPATQVVYRFDDHRYLTMTGHGCEGAIYYVDERRKIRTTYIDQFARVFLPRIVHADNDGDFIFSRTLTLPRLLCPKIRVRRFRMEDGLINRPSASRTSNRLLW